MWTRSVTNPHIKADVAGEWMSCLLDILKETVARTFFAQTLHKLFDQVGVSLDFHRNSLQRVLCPSRQTKFSGQSIDKWTKANSLHGAAN